MYRMVVNDMKDLLGPAYTLKEIHDKVYIWDITEKQLNAALNTLCTRIFSLSGSIHEGLVNGMLLNTIGKIEADCIQTTIDKLRELPKQLRVQLDTLKPLCSHEVDRKFTMQVFIPQEILAIADMRNILRDFEQAANIIGDLDLFSLQYRIRPELTEQIKSSRIFCEIPQADGSDRL